jgi:hypothetical protein
MVIILYCWHLKKGNGYDLLDVCNLFMSLLNKNGNEASSFMALLHMKFAHLGTSP